MGAFRDYIPEGENPTPAEKARFENARALIRGGVRHDFVPGSDHKLRPPAPHGASVALKRAMKDAERAIRVEFDAAKKRLAQLTLSDAVGLISDMPLATQEMYLVAEQATGNRKDLLDQFPEPSDQAKALYGQAMAEAAPADSGTAEE